jgi:hypothetical protein
MLCFDYLLFYIISVANLLHSPFDASNFEVAPRFLENLYTPAFDGGSDQ